MVVLLVLLVAMDQHQVLLMPNVLLHGMTVVFNPYGFFFLKGFCFVLSLDSPLGTYSDVEGISSSLQCKLCPIGRYGSTVGLTSASCTAACPVIMNSISV